MAEPVTAQARLDRIVVLIASNMVAEVCSVYVARADGPLELFATEGLNREAVHLTTMRPGEGLVGLIAATAEPLALSDAQNHPAFSYKPETGEEIYQSFLGVPVLRSGATLGVLVVQNRARRTYSEEEIEALQTTAMLLAEMIVSGELQALAGQPWTVQGVAWHVPLMHTPLLQSVVVPQEQTPSVQVCDPPQSLFTLQPAPSPQVPIEQGLVDPQAMGSGEQVLPPHWV